MKIPGFLMLIGMKTSVAPKPNALIIQQYIVILIIAFGHERSLLHKGLRVALE